MPKLRLITFTLLALSAATAVHAEEKRYVSDELSTWVRSGPGDNYRLVGTINAGEAVDVLQTNDSTNYAQVRDSNGRTAWIPLKELSNEPSLRTRVPDLENQVKTLTDKLNNIDATWNQRTADMQKKVAGRQLEVLFSAAAGRPIPYSRFSDEVLAASPFLHKLTAGLA